MSIFRGVGRAFADFARLRARARARPSRRFVLVSRCEDAVTIALTLGAFGGIVTLMQSM